jgi:hypothetical protein
MQESIANTRIRIEHQDSNIGRPVKRAYVQTNKIQLQESSMGLNAAYKQMKSFIGGTVLIF